MVTCATDTGVAAGLRVAKQRLFCVLRRDHRPQRIGPADFVQCRFAPAAGDDADVTVDLFAGSVASGSPVQTVAATRDGSGSFDAQFGQVAAGAYTVTARQRDAAGNSGSSAPVAFSVAGPAAAAPDFAVFATEESLDDAAAGRMSALSSCEGTCSRTTSLVASARAATKLGLPHRAGRALRLGGATKAGGAGGVRVGVSRRVRTALRRSRGTTATLSVTAGSVSLSRAIALKHELSPAGLASHGLKLAGICSSQCKMSARLIISAATARRLGIRTSGRSVAVGTGSVTAAGSAAQTFMVRVASSVRRALSRAKAADVTLEVTVAGSGGASRRATRRITLG